MTKTYDVIIVSGGPTGIFAALELHKASASEILAAREVQKRLKARSHIR